MSGFLIALLGLLTHGFLASGPAVNQPDSVPSVEELHQKAERTLATLEDYTGKIIRRERLDGKIKRQYNAFKFARPFKVYLGFIKPHRGREVIYVRGWNDNELRVHRGSFPDLTLNLDPEGSTAMKGNHHPITHFGLEYTVRASARNLRLAIRRGEGEVRVTDGGTLFGRAVWRIEATFPRSGYHVTARADETLWDISRRTGQDMFLILYSNQDKEYDDPDDVDEGDRVFIPRYYGGRAEFNVSKDTGLPVKVVTWDWRGRLYECYEYPETDLNVGLTRNDFNPDNDEYGF